jgi:hypothetical protein
MKNNLSENDYLLSNIEVYKEALNDNESQLIKVKYIELLCDFVNYFSEKIKIKNKNYLISKGLETITHIFTIILSKTKNLLVTFLNCQKGFYLFTEFIEQISDEHNVFLQLSSKDAIMYVYKKTIFEINENFVKLNEFKISDEIFLIRSLVEVFVKTNFDKNTCSHCCLKLVHYNFNLSQKELIYFVLEKIKNEKNINIFLLAFFKNLAKTNQFDKLKNYILNLQTFDIHDKNLV